MKTFTPAVFGVATLLMLTACGGNNGSSTQGQSIPSSQVTSGVKLTAQAIPSLGKVLVDAAGVTVYADEQETTGHIACDGSCTSIWLPVTVPAGGKPIAGPGVTARLGTIPRPDGQLQVTAEGQPLYVFSLDASPGGTGGNGVMDSFGETSFSWHAVAPTGGLVDETSTPTPTSSQSGGGYHY